MRQFVLLALVVAAMPAMVQAGAPVGGGSCDGGFRGEYFANATLSGKPSFTRTDIRIRFDWGTKLPILGVHAESLRDFPVDNFSVRWTGKVVPRFSESYSFELTSDEGARLLVKQPGADKWSTLIDNWKAHQRATDKASLKMEAGKAYEMKLEYYDVSGPAVVELRWSSPSTPLEIIDPLGSGSISGNTYPPRMWANAVRSGQPWHVKPELVDGKGWPKCDINGWACEGGWRSPPGRYRMRFDGKAELEIDGATFLANGKTYVRKLPADVGYDAAKNQTTVDFDFAKDEPNGRGLFISFRKTQRKADLQPGSGFTNLVVMKPIAAGADRSHEPGEVGVRGLRAAFAPYASFRWQALWDGGVWAQRALPDFGKHADDVPRGDPARNVPCYEELILLANESGRDILFGFGASIDYDCMRKIAQTFRYGSDGVNPYDHEVDQPVYPPLNPNLNIYLEHGNEMGWSAIQPRKWHQDLIEHQKNNSPEWQIVNYDGKMTQTAGEATYRYHAYRTVRMGEAFRGVFGDAAMMERIRPLLFGQGAQQYEPMMLQFVDAYYNNGDGKQHVKQPHPVNYYLFGTGVAIYYGSANNYGQMNPEPLADNSFEATKVADGAAVLRPKDSPWKFSGKAGVCNVKTPRQAALTKAKLGATEKAKKAGWYGVKFTVGPKDIYVYQIGRLVQQGNKADHKVGLFCDVPFKNWAGLQHKMRETSAAIKGVNVGEFAYGPLEQAGWPLNWESFRQAPARLKAGATYYVLSDEAADGDVLGVAETAVESTSAIKIDGAAYSADGETFEVVSAGKRSFGPVNMIYTDAIIETPEGVVGVPPDPNLPPNGKHKQEPMGVQTAFLCGQAAIGQEVDIPEDGDYAVLFRAAASQIKTNKLNVSIDDKRLWKEQAPGAHRKPADVLYAYSTTATPLKKGRHTIRIEGVDSSAEACVFLDGVQVASINEIMRTIPAKGQETSGKADDRWERTLRKMADFSRLWGLTPCTYEGGWSLGGDWDAGGMGHWHYAKYESPLAADVGFRCASLYSQAGGWMFAYGTYEQFVPFDVDRAAAYPLWQAVSRLSEAWTYEPAGGIALPGKLTPAAEHYHFGVDANGRTSLVGPTTWGKPNTSAKLSAGEWKAWIVVAPRTGEYRISAETTRGGRLRILADESNVVAEAASGGPLKSVVKLTQGQHCIKLKAVDGAFEAPRIVVEAAK